MSITKVKLCSEYPQPSYTSSWRVQHLRLRISFRPFRTHSSLQSNTCFARMDLGLFNYNDCINDDYYSVDLEVIMRRFSPHNDFKTHYSVSLSISQCTQPVKLVDRVGLLPLSVMSYPQRNVVSGIDSLSTYTRYQQAGLSSCSIA
jgi:hypothetical protein